MDISKMYCELLEYTKHLEDLLKQITVFDDKDLSEIRKGFISPASNPSRDLDK